MASTIYRDSAALNPMPATQIIGGQKAAMVSVNSKLSTPAGTPPVPAVNFTKHSGKAVRPVMVKMPSSSSDGSSATSNLKTMKPVALNIIRKVQKPADASSVHSATSQVTTRDEKRMTKASMAASELSVDTHRRARLSGHTHRSSHMTGYSEMDDEEEHERSRHSLLDSKVPVTSPFTDAAEAKAPGDDTPLKVSTPTTPHANVERGKSPFDDPEDTEADKKTLK
jgi:hypothetical protein